MKKTFSIKEIIEKKANKQVLTKQEIEFAVNNFTNGIIPDYQMSALLMAIYCNGLTDKEVFDLTDCMLHSGEIIDVSNLGITVDKHSTGGVSDTTTLVIAPICATLGVNMLKLSGRGLGHTGGTIDKLESFYGYQADIPIEDAKQLTIKNGACIISSTKELAPADKKMYALRDITSTVKSLPLIASSVMSKKLASGSQIIVLDVKYGNGAFMQTKKEAQKLGSIMKKIGDNAGKNVAIFISNMNQPLGYNVGPMLEAYESIEVLNGKKGLLYNDCVNISAKCVSIAKNIPIQQAKNLVIECINNKSALKKLKEMVTSQGGQTFLFDGLSIKPKLVIYSKNSGKVTGFNTKLLGELVGQMGAVRQNLTSKINYEVGIKTFHKIGDSVKKGDALFEIYANTTNQAKEFSEKFINSISIK